MSHSDPTIDRRLELLLDRTLQGLDPTEAAELARLTPPPDHPDDLAVELAAAALDLTSFPNGNLPDLPPELATRIERNAARFLADPAGRRGVSVVGRRLGRVVPWLGWVAAAASLALLVHDRGIGPRPVPVVALTDDPIPRAPRVQLVASTHPLARGASGSLAWDGARQEGALQVAGLAPVDPASGCYQLWIFDSSRDRRYPIDGGMFTVPRAKQGGSADQVVRIHPQIPVRAATLFAITLEPPGGVVVSDRERVLLTANWGPTNPAPAPAPPRQDQSPQP